LEFEERRIAYMLEGESYPLEDVSYNMIGIPVQKMLAVVEIPLWGAYPPCIYKTKTAYHASAIAEEIPN
jgi:hypothetical protein